MIGATRRSRSSFRDKGSPTVSLMSGPQKPGPGRPSKGVRATVVGKVHPEVAAAVRAGATEWDLPITEYVAAVLANVHGLPQYAPAMARGPRELEQLPLSA